MPGQSGLAGKGRGVVGPAHAVSIGIIEWQNPLVILPVEHLSEWFAGFRKPMGKRASLNVQVLFDVLQNDNSPYKAWEPFYSVGVGVGF